ncbi:MAG: hypothetical protein Q8W44_11860 [Candidatus Palauibacterales bacterium]|nr:hypothetical protein [Candidatus Palauibacterales bacterium]
MWQARDTRKVEFALDLPEDLAEDVERVRQDDPEFLSKVIRYGLTRRAVYQELDQAMEDRTPEA